jgi:molybdopterin synthase sulfur carrier subunit
MITVTLQYFAQLREQAGASGEQVSTAADSLRALYAELGVRHGFSLPADALKVAVNAKFSDWSRPLREGDVVVFIPPVAGG